MTIENAVEGLPKGVADHITAMFRLTGYLDIYGGNLEMYLELIERTAIRRVNKIL